MLCVKCKTETRYNRAVVTPDGEEIFGGFCSTCEREAFGRTLIERPFGHLEGCVECPAPGAAAVPEHVLEISIQSDNEYVTEGYTVDEETPVFCSEHLPVRISRPESVELRAEQVHIVDRS